MPAKSNHALEKKRLNRISKRQISREAKINSLGGVAISIEYGNPLEEEQSNKRHEYLLDLMYPDRKAVKRKDGTPRKKKYKTELERREAKRAQQRKVYAKQKGITVDEIREYPEKAHSRSPWGTMHYGAKARAKELGLPFNLTKEYLMEIWNDTCPVLGIELKKGTKTMADNSPCLDRFVPEKGYVVGNVNIISNLANRIKTNADWRQVFRVAKWMKSNTL